MQWNFNFIRIKFFLRRLISIILDRFIVVVMANENGGRSFPQDIFAEDNDNWQWGSTGSNSKTSASVPSYGVIPGIAKFDSSRSTSSEDELVYPSDSNSQRRTFRKRGSSTGSEENLPEGVCYSPNLQDSLPRERPPPSIFDDDARSGSPSGNYEHKNLAFIPSFHNEFGSTADKKKETSPLHIASLGMKSDKAYERAIVQADEIKHDALRTEGLSKNFPVNASKISLERRKSEKSRSRSPSNSNYRSPSRSQSRCKEPRGGSPYKDGHSSSARHLQTSSRNRGRSSRGRRSRSPVPRPRSRSRDSRRRSRSKDSRRRSRSRDSRRRSRSKDSHRRSRSKDSHRRSRSRDSRRRSRSRDIRRRSRSRESHKRSRSRDSRKRRSRSRSCESRRRDRYRSSSRDRYRRRRHSRSRSHSRDRSKGRSGSSSRKPGSLPLSTSGVAMTPQMALQQTMAAMSAKAQAMTGIALPKYYNPAAVNPLKYAEQVQKRKLLWQTKDKEEEQQKNTVWDKLKFAQDQDGKMTAKFRKLMGIKSEGNEPKTEEEKESVLKKQEELFRDLDQQYEMARVTTHTQRGVGLGYSAQPLFPAVPK